MKVSHFYRKKDFDSFNPYFNTVDVEDPETKRLQELVFCPDPETGNPRSDVSYLMTGADEGFKAFIKEKLLQPGVNQGLLADTPDEAMQFVKPSIMSSEQYYNEMRNYVTKMFESDGNAS